MLRISLLMFFCLAVIPAYADGSCRSVGSTTYCSDGSTHRQVGNTLYSSDGSTHRQVGNTIYSSDGSTHRMVGNSVYSSDGSTHRRVGNSVYSSDGSVHRGVGNSIYSSGGLSIGGAAALRQTEKERSVTDYMEDYSEKFDEMERASAADSEQEKRPVSSLSSMFQQDGVTFLPE